MPPAASSSKAAATNGALSGKKLDGGTAHEMSGGAEITMSDFWPKDGAPIEMEPTFRKWSTARQIMELEKALKGQKNVVREALSGRFLAAKLATQPDRRAQLDGLVAKPELNGMEVELLGAVGADGRIPVRVRSNKAEIRVSMAKLLPPRENSRGAGGKRRLKAFPSLPGDGDALKETELSRELAQRRAALLAEAENLTLRTQHLTEHQVYLNTQAEKLQGAAEGIRKRFAIVQGLYKSTKDADKVLALRSREEAIRAQEAAYNANIVWLRRAQQWLEEQPAMIAARAKMEERMERLPNGQFIERPPKGFGEGGEDGEGEGEMSFEALLAEMKLEDARKKSKDFPDPPGPVELQ